MRDEERRELAADILRAADAWETATMQGYGARVTIAGRELSAAIQRARVALRRTDVRPRLPAPLDALTIPEGSVGDIK